MKINLQKLIKFVFINLIFINLALASDINLSKKEIEYLKNNPTLKVGYDTSFEPLILIDEIGNVSGLYFDYLSLVSKKLGIKVEFDIDTWDNILNKLKNKEIDFIPGLARKLASKNNYLITDSFIDVYLEVFINSNNKKNIKSFDDLKGLKVAYNKNIKVLDNYLQENKELYELIPTDTSIESIRKLQYNQVDAYVGFKRTRYLTSKYDIKDIKAVFRFDDLNIDTVAAIRDDSPILQSIIQKTITSLSLNEIDTIAQKWLGKETYFTNISKLTLNQREKEYLENNTFTICENFDIYPLSGVQNNRLIGIRGEYIDEVVKRTGLKLKVLSAKSLKDLREKVFADKCDMIGSLGSTQKIFPMIKNTNIVMSFPYGIMGDINSFNMGPHNDLSEYTFIVRFKNIKNKILSKYPDLNIEVINDIDKAISRVGKNTYFVALRPVTERIIQDYGFEDYKFNGVFDNVYQDSTMGVHEKHPILLNIINKTINSIESDISNRILDKYSIKEFKVEKNYNNILLGIIFIILFLNVFLLFRMYQRKKEYAKELEYKVKDATYELKKLNEKLTQEKDIFNKTQKIAQIGSFNTSMIDGKQWYSNTLKEIFGYEKDEEFNRDIWLKHIHIDDLDEVENYTKEIFEKQNYVNHILDYRIYTKQNVLKYVQISWEFRRVENGKISFIEGNVQDVTTQKKLETELSTYISQLEVLNLDLQNKNEELSSSEEELRVQQEELVNNQNQIEKLAKAKEQFLANMSHEIRTPLNGIIGIVDMLLDEVKNNDSVVEKLNILKKSSNILTNIVNDILDYSSIQTGNLKFQQKDFSFRNMIKHIDNTIRGEIEDKNLEFDIIVEDNVHDMLIGDEYRLSQIFLNILSNSKKFTKEGKISLKVKNISNSNHRDNLLIEIKDTGIGMNEKLLKQLFVPFTQGNISNTKEFKGTGLGLSIVKNLVDLMGGKVDIYSLEGLGTTVRIILNFHHSTKKQVDEIKEEIVILPTKKKALLAEDDRTNQIVIKDYLEKRNFNVDIVINGLGAVKKLEKENSYDVIFMDIQMPVMDGHEATRQIREFNKDIPIIALSAGVLPENIKKSLDAGMNMHIVKPIIKEELNEVIRKYLI